MRSQVQPIGVDIGFDSIKMLQLEVSDGLLSVVSAVRRELPDEARTHPELRVPLAVELIRQMLRQSDFRGRRIVTALPREIVQVKNLRLPMIPPGELESAVQFEARNIFSFDADEAQIRHLYAGEVRQGNDTRQEVIVLGARHQDVNGFLEQIYRSGCIVESLDFEPCAIYRSVERFIRRREDEHEVHVLVDVGARRTQVVIGRGRELSFFKPIEIGGQNFHEAISRKLEISIDEARELRRRIIGEHAAGTDPTSPPDHEPGGDPVRQAVFDATRSMIEELAREVSLCLRYHSVTFRGHRPQNVRVIGGEAVDPQLQSILASALPIPVECAKPLQNVDTSRMHLNGARQSLCEWTVAFGLALKLTQSYFGSRDGKRRDNGAAASSSAQVIDLARALQEPIPADPNTNPPGKQEALHA